jgi:hypothetical protein
MAYVKTGKNNKGEVYARAPYDELFIAAAKRLRGRWNPDLRMWKFPLGVKEKQVGDLLESYFGPSAFNGEFKPQ